MLHLITSLYLRRILFSAQVEVDRRIEEKGGIGYEYIHSDTVWRRFEDLKIL